MLLLKIISSKGKTIAFIGKGGAGKSTLFGNLFFQITKDLNEIGSRQGLYAMDFDAIPHSHYVPEKLIDNIINVTSDLTEFKKLKPMIIDLIVKQKNNNHIIFNLPGDNTLDLFMELIDHIDEIILVTHQEENAHNTTTEIISNMYKYLQNRNNFFERIFMIYSQVGKRWAAAQFDSARFRKKVNNELFQHYEPRIKEYFIKNNINKSFEFIDIPRTEKQVKSSKIISSTADISIIPLFHIERSSFVHRSTLQHRPFILDYLDQNDLLTLPLPVRAIKENSSFITNNIFNFEDYDNGKKTKE